MNRFIRFEKGLHITLSENKNIEIEWDTNRSWFWLNAGINSGDHWGFEFYISILKISLSFIFFDKRHR